MLNPAGRPARRRRLALLAPAVLAAACGDDEPPAAGEVLADRVVAVLELDEAADVTCPEVRATAPGDRATCVVDDGAGGVLEVDVEFEADGAITVVAVLPR